MDRGSRIFLTAALAWAVLPASLPSARADRLGGNYRGPRDVYVFREDPVAPAESTERVDPLLASLGLDSPFRTGIEAARHEAEFRGRPLLVFFVLRNCPLGESAAERAFGDAEVLDLVTRFVPVVMDAEEEEVFGVTHGVRTLPTILLYDRAGKETARAEGVVDASRVVALLREGLRLAGPARPSPKARALGRNALLLSRARAAKNWREVLDASSDIERIGHAGPEMDEARTAVREASEEAALRLEEVRHRILEGGTVPARKDLEEIVRVFGGLKEAREAADLLVVLEESRSASGTRSGRLRPFGASNTNVLDSALPGQAVIPDPVSVPESMPTREEDPVEDP